MCVPVSKTLPDSKLVALTIGVSRFYLTLVWGDKRFRKTCFNILKFIGAEGPSFSCGGLFLKEIIW